MQKKLSLQEAWSLARLYVGPEVALEPWDGVRGMRSWGLSTAELEQYHVFRELAADPLSGKPLSYGVGVHWLTGRVIEVEFR